MTYPLNGRLVRTFLFGAFLCAIPIAGSSQRVVCSDGFGSFDATSASGVAVSVGALKESGLARRVIASQRGTAIPSEVTRQAFQNDEVQ
jgi:hypothetical protein